MTSSGKNLKLSERKDRILANIIKKTHSELRQKVQESQGDESVIWKSHVKSLKENDSKDYAEAMKNLSNEHWSNESRLKWICQKLMLYFVEKDNSRFYSRIQRRQNESSESTDIDTKMVLKTLLFLTYYKSAHTQGFAWSWYLSQTCNLQAEFICLDWADKM